MALKRPLVLDHFEQETYQQTFAFKDLFRTFRNYCCENFNSTIPCPEQRIESYVRVPLTAEFHRSFQLDNVQHIMGPKHAYGCLRGRQPSCTKKNNMDPVPQRTGLEFAVLDCVSAAVEQPNVDVTKNG
jgi:hypothetical protein